MKKILVLGADGLIGNSLYEKLENNKGIKIEGTSRKKNSKHLFLDVNDEKSINKINWGDYGIIYYCIGNIDYENQVNSLILNIKVNVVGPLKIIKKLKPDQKFIYLSTYVVQLELGEQNPYSFSKFVFEKLIKMNEEYHNIKIIRIPGIYSSRRKDGFMSNLKKSFHQNKRFILNFEPKVWHIMKLERVIDILSIFLKKDIQEKIINIGYPLIVQPKEIIKIFENYFKKEIPIILKKFRENTYNPDIKILHNYYGITEKDFYDDIKKYLGEDL